MKTLDSYKYNIGKFYLNRDFMESTSIELLKQIMSSVVIVRAELLYHVNGIEYIAVSPEFEKVDIGSIPDTYKAIVENNNFLGWVPE